MTPPSLTEDDTDHLWHWARNAKHEPWAADVLKLLASHAAQAERIATQASTISTYIDANEKLYAEIARLTDQLAQAGPVLDVSPFAEPTRCDNTVGSGSSKEGQGDDRIAAGSPGLPTISAMARVLKRAAGFDRVVDLALDAGAGSIVTLDWDEMAREALAYAQAMNNQPKKSTK
jgi:hypothetical protein